MQVTRTNNTSLSTKCQRGASAFDANTWTCTYFNWSFNCIRARRPFDGANTTLPKPAVRSTLKYDFHLRYILCVRVCGIAGNKLYCRVVYGILIGVFNCLSLHTYIICAIDSYRNSIPGMLHNVREPVTRNSWNVCNMNYQQSRVSIMFPAPAMRVLLVSWFRISTHWWFRSLPTFVTY